MPFPESYFAEAFGTAEALVQGSHGIVREFGGSLLEFDLTFGDQATFDFPKISSFHKPDAAK